MDPADWRVPSGLIKEMQPVGKDERRAMIVLALLVLCGDSRLSAGRRDMAALTSTGPDPIQWTRELSRSALEFYLSLAYHGRRKLRVDIERVRMLAS